MAARIRSLVNAINPIDEASRDDLVAGDIVTVQSIDAATTYDWAIVFAPQDIAGNPSTATFSGDPTAVSPGSFTVDHEGPYLIRLVVDAGLATEDTQYVRLRSLTLGLGLTLVSAGERRDGSGIIPVDVSSEGWANEQNFNLLKLQAAIAAADSLADTLVIGNVTGGTDIELTTGDELIGQTDVVLRSTGAASNIEINPDAAGAAIVNGKLAVTGLIDDPTGLVLTEQAADPATTGAGEGTFWVKDNTPNTPMFTDDAGTDWALVQVVPGTDPNWNVVLTGGPVYAASNREFIIITSATCEITLPVPSANARIAFKLAVTPVDVQVKSHAAGTLIDGTDYSIAGLPMASQWEQFNVISDGTNWFIW